MIIQVQTDPECSSVSGHTRPFLAVLKISVHKIEKKVNFELEMYFLGQNVSYTSYKPLITIIFHTYASIESLQKLSNTFFAYVRKKMYSTTFAGSL